MKCVIVCCIQCERVRAVSRRVCERGKIARDYVKTRPLYAPRPPIRAITEATFSSELLLVANQTLAAYSLVDEGSIARKSEASPCVVHSKAKC